jgi:hypothetical protein
VKFGGVAVRKSEILDRCVNLGKLNDSKVLDLDEVKFVPRLNPSRFRRPAEAVTLSGSYDDSGDVQVIGLSEGSAAILNEFSSKLDDEVKGYVKINKVMREVIWIAPFSEVQKKHLGLSHDTYLVLTPIDSKD